MAAKAEGAGDRKRRPRLESQSVSAVHDRIRNAILYGQLEADASISQHLLADQFEAGRTPLREALRMLQREGLVVAEPNYPVRIASLSPDGFEELYVRRIALEAVAIRITVPRLTSDDIAELEAAMTKMDHYHKAADELGARASHRDFHRILIAGAGPSVTAEIIMLADHSERYRQTFGVYGSWRDRRAEHRRILDAAKAGDAELAAHGLGEHYANTAMMVFEALASNRDPESLRVTIRAVAPGAEAALGNR